MATFVRRRPCAPAIFLFAAVVAAPCFAGDGPMLTPTVAPIVAHAGWVPLGGELKLGLFVRGGTNTQTGVEAIKVYGVGSDGALWTIESADGGAHWSDWVSHNGQLESAPACTYDGTRCYWDHGSHTLFGQAQEASGGDPESLVTKGHPLAASPTVAGDTVFIHALDDNALWFAPMDGSGQVHGDWQSMGGELQGTPSCLKTGEYKTGPGFGTTHDVFTCYAIGSDGHMWRMDSVQDHLAGTSVVSGTHYEWTPIGGDGLDGVSAWRKSWQDNYDLVAVRGTDSALWIYHPVANEWRRHDGDIASAPACLGKHCFAILPDGQLGTLSVAADVGP